MAPAADLVVDAEVVVAEWALVVLAFRVELRETPADHRAKARKVGHVKVNPVKVVQAKADQMKVDHQRASKLRKVHDEVKVAITKAQVAKVSEVPAAQVASEALVGLVVLGLVDLEALVLAGQVVEALISIR